MLLVFNRGGPGSYRSRERRGVISQKETLFYSIAQPIPRSLNQHFQKQPSLPENHTQDKPSPTRLLRRRSMISARRNTLLISIGGCDGCSSRVCCMLLPDALADLKSKFSYYVTRAVYSLSLIHI